MNLKPRHFANMHYKIYDVDDIYDIPEVALLDLPEMDPLELKLLLKYAIYMYDRGSPVSRERSLTRRQTISMKLAGFDSEDAAHYPDLESGVRNSNAKGLNQIIMQVLLGQGRDIWFNICVTEVVMQEIHSRLLSNIQSSEVTDVYLALKRKTELLPILEENYNRIKTWKETFYDPVHEDEMEGVQKMPITPETVQAFGK